MSLFRLALRASIATSAVAVAFASQPVLAQESSYQFNIPAQGMKASLHALARTSGQQITFNDAAVQGKSAPALVGSYTVRAGIDRLLSGSGLAATWGQSGVIVVSPAAANEVEQPTEMTTEAEPADAIVVTGSRIQRAFTDSPVPIVGVGAQDIAASGATELSEVLADYPAVTPGSNLANSNNSINAAGLSSINLRGLGTNRTLTLVDGRRTVSNQLTSNAVSLSTIPTMFVERVEIITGGASAVYGADAVAGVVNIITRDKFDGVRVGGRAGISTQGDASRLNADMLVGKRFLDDRVSVILGASYEREAGLMGSDRARSMESVSYSPTVGDNDPNNTGTIGITRPALNSYSPGGRFLSSTSPGYFYYDANGNLARSPDVNVYGHEVRPYLQLSAPRTSYLAAGKLTADLTDNVAFFSQVQFSKVETDTMRGGADTASDGDTYGVLDEFTLGRIARSNPFVPAAIRAVASSSGVQWRRRLNEVGNYTILNNRETWRTWAGFKGTINDNWRWEASYGYGLFQQDQNRRNLFDYGRLKNALNAEFDPAAPTDLSRVRCVDAAARAAGCAPINVFGVGSISKAAADYIRADLRLDTKVTQNVLSGFVSGTLLELPAGPVAVAFGGEWRRDWQRSITDESTRLGLGSASFIAEYEGNIKAKEVFGEVSIPLLSDMPFFNKLSIDGAARLGNYNIARVGTVFSYRFGGEWAPVEDLRFRAQFSRAQRAPTVTNLYSPLRDDADTVVDLCNGVTATTTGTVATNCRSIPAIAAAITTNGRFTQTSTSIQGPSSGNPNLKEETADTLSLGAVLTPTFAPGLSLTVDYFKIKIRDAIGALEADELMRECYGNPNGITDNYFCNEITRDADGQLRRIINRDLNLSRIQRSGIDAELSYRFNAPSWISDSAKFDLRVLYSRLLDFKTIFDGVNGVAVTDEKGQIGSWRDQGQAQVGYSDGGLRLRYKVRYTGKAVDSNARLAVAKAAGSKPPFLWIDEKYRHDLYASQEVGTDAGELRVYAGVNNLFNSISPFLPSGTVSGGTLNVSGDYDVVGRYVYAGFEMKF